MSVWDLIEVILSIKLLQWRFCPVIILWRILQKNRYIICLVFPINLDHSLDFLVLNALEHWSFLTEKDGEWVFQLAKYCRKDAWLIFLLRCKYHIEVNFSAHVDCLLKYDCLYHKNVFPTSFFKPFCLKKSKLQRQNVDIIAFQI